MRKRRTTDSFIEEMKDINPDIEILGKYVTIHTKIAWRCRECDYKGNSEPASLLAGHGCKTCAKKRATQKRRKTNEQFLKELAEKIQALLHWEHISNLMNQFIVDVHVVTRISFSPNHSLSTKKAENASKGLSLFNSFINSFIVFFPCCPKRIVKCFIC